MTVTVIPANFVQSVDYYLRELGVGSAREVVARAKQGNTPWYENDKRVPEALDELVARGDAARQSDGRYRSTTITKLPVAYVEYERTVEQVQPGDTVVSADPLRVRRTGYITRIVLDVDPNDVELLGMLGERPGVYHLRFENGRA